MQCSILLYALKKQLYQHLTCVKLQALSVHFLPLSPVGHETVSGYKRHPVFWTGMCGWLECGSTYSKTCFNKLTRQKNAQVNLSLLLNSKYSATRSQVRYKFQQNTIWEGTLCISFITQDNIMWLKI